MNIRSRNMHRLAYKTMESSIGFTNLELRTRQYADLKFVSP